MKQHHKIFSKAALTKTRPIIRSAGFVQIDKVLNKTAKYYSLETALYRHKALKQWQKVAGAFFEEAEKQTKAIDFKQGILTVACLSREAAFKVRFLAERIICALNELLGRAVIYAIRVEI